MSRGALNEQIKAVAVALDEVSGSEDPARDVDPRVLQGLLGGAVRAFAARRRSGDDIDAFDAAGEVDAPTSTDVAIAVTAMLESAGIEIFELGLWEAWASRSGRTHKSDDDERSSDDR